MANGLKPIGDSIKPIIDKIKKEREEKRKRKGNKPVRTQPKLPGMKKGGSAKKGGVKGAMVISISIGKAKDYPGAKEIMKKNKKGKKKFVEGGIAFGGEKRIPGSGAAFRGTGFKGIF